jgi:hypothetical protein
VYYESQKSGLLEAGVVVKLCQSACADIPGTVLVKCCWDERYCFGAMLLVLVLCGGDGIAQYVLLHLIQ